MSRNNHTCILIDITGHLLSTVFQDEAAKSSQIHIFSVYQGCFYTLHESFHYLKYFFSVCSRFQGDLVHNFCFSHNLICFLKGCKDTEIHPILLLNAGTKNKPSLSLIFLLDHEYQLSSTVREDAVYN